VKLNNRLATSKDVRLKLHNFVDVRVIKHELSYSCIWCRDATELGRNMVERVRIKEKRVLIWDMMDIIGGCSDND
jgi:hypothetical protein